MTQEPRWEPHPYSQFLREDERQKAEQRAVQVVEPGIMTSVARLFAAFIMIVLWIVIVLPVWFALLLRTILAFSVATIIALFSSSTPPHPGRLDAAATLWMNGLQRIVTNIRHPEASPDFVAPIPFYMALYETILAIIFYAGLVSTVWFIYSGIIDLIRAKLW